MKVHCMRLGRGLFITIYVGVTTPHAFLQTAGGWADVNVSFCFEGLSNRLTERIELTYRKHMHALLFIEGVNGRNMQKPHLISASDLDLVAISDSPHWHHSVLVFLSLRLKAISVLKWISHTSTNH